MSNLLLQEEEERIVIGQMPHLSYSRINRYLHCPEQDRLYYIEKLRPKLSPAALVFGKVLHQSFAHFFNRLVTPWNFSCKSGATSKLTTSPISNGNPGKSSEIAARG